MPAAAVPSHPKSDIIPAKYVRSGLVASGGFLASDPSIHRSRRCSLPRFSPVLDRFGVPLLGAQAGAQERQLAAWPVAVRRAQISAPAFKHFDYVNPNAPKGGAVRMIAIRHLRQFQRGRGRAEGLDRDGRRNDLRHVAGIGARRGVDRIRADRRSGRAIRPTSHRRRSACAPARATTMASRSPSRT